MKTVNFLEAINSGKEFKTEGSEDECYFSKMDNGFRITGDLEYFNNRFQLKEKEITITESEFDKAFKEYINVGITQTFKKELGF